MMDTRTDASHGSPGEGGSVLLIVLGVLVVVGALAAALSGLVTTGVESRLSHVSGDRAFYLAESGARYAIARLRAGGLDALPQLTGKAFTLANGAGFELDVTYTDTGSTYLFEIDSVGFGGGDGSSRQSVNGYQVEIPKYTETLDLPVSFRYGVEMLTDTVVDITGSAYMDSYDSLEDGMGWTTPGGYSDAVLRVDTDEDALKLGWSTILYGSISVPEGTDISDPTTIVNRPENVVADPKIVAEAASTPVSVPLPEEPEEVAKPVSWDAVPDFQAWGSDTIDGGSYAVSRDFSPSSAALTVTDSLALDVGRDLQLTGSGSLAVDGDLNAWVERDFNVSGGGTGLTIDGDADIQVGRNFDLTSSQSMVVEGDLDLDVDGTFSISGDSTLHVKGDAYIDVGGDFSISGSGKLVVDGKVIIHAQDGLSLTGGSGPIVFGEDGSVQIYVDSGKIIIASAVINDPSTTEKFVVVGGEDVKSLAITGNSKVSGAFYVPYSTFALTGSSELFGGIVADSVQSFNGTSAIHQDRALAKVTVDLDEQPVRRYWVASGD